MRFRRNRKKAKKWVHLELEKDGEIKKVSMRMSKKIGMLKVAKKLGSLGKQKEGILVEMRAKFRINTSIFQNQIRALGYMPIKDENITVSICALHSRCMQ